LFLLKKSATETHRIICEMYGENVIVIRICANWFKRWFRYQWQRRSSGRFAVEEDDLWKDGKQLWKTMKNTLI